MNTEDRLIRLGREAAALVEPDMIVGLGTGSTAVAMIEALGERVNAGLRFTGVATSRSTEDLARSLAIEMTDLDAIDRLDLCIDGADEVDEHLNVVKGRGGALLFEKLVARQANRYVIIAADEKRVTTLGDRLPLPVEIVPVGWRYTVEQIADLGLEPELRRTSSHTPFVTDGHHYVVDCRWSAHENDPSQLAHMLKSLTGVVEHGLFLKMATDVMLVDADGHVTSQKHPTSQAVR